MKNTQTHTLHTYTHTTHTTHTYRLTQSHTNINNVACLKPNLSGYIVNILKYWSRSIDRDKYNVKNIRFIASLLWNTKMTTFIKMKFNKSDDQINSDNIE